MIRAIFTTILILLVILPILLILNIHIIRDQDGTTIIWKDSMILKDTYVDARDWTIGDYFNYPPAVRDFVLDKQCAEMKRKLRAKGKKIKDKIHISEEEWQRFEQAMNQKYAKFKKNLKSGLREAKDVSKEMTDDFYVWLDRKLQGKSLQTNSHQTKKEAVSRLPFFYRKFYFPQILILKLELKLKLRDSGYGIYSLIN